MRRSEVFVDSACVIAMLSETDQHYAAAAALYGDLRNEARFVTTHAICLEIGNALARSRVRALVAEFLASLQHDADLEVVPVSEGLYTRALRLFGSRPDKSWSLTDCFSFVVMADRGITRALTTDRHFRQAGFQPLLALDYD